jgi:Bacterial EndoU nuclease
VAADRPADDTPEEIDGGIHETRDGDSRHLAGVSASAEIAETRTRAEYYLALRATVDRQERAFATKVAQADNRPRSAWDNVDAASRPPLDALRMSPERAIHILDGDATGGGHRYGTGAPGKTEFPSNWGDDKITDSILSVARSPESASLQRNGRWKVEGVRDGVTLAVIITVEGNIWSSYPLPGAPGVRQNPKDS